MGHPTRIAAATLAVCLLLTGPPASGGDDLASLRSEYASAANGRDDAAYAAQAVILTRIADLKTAGARTALQSLLEQYGRADRRRALLILKAQARHASPRELDAVIRWVERTHRDPLLLELLHRILADIHTPSARAWLRTDALKKATPRIKVQIVMAIGRSGDAQAVIPLLQLLREENLDVRIETLLALGRLKARQALGLVQVFLRDHESEMRDAAARALGAMGDRRAIPALRKALRDEHPRVVESTARALGTIGDPGAIPDLLAGLEKVHANDLRLADAFVSALQTISGKDIGNDPDLWRSWWKAAKDERFEPSTGRPGRKTVPGIRYHTIPVRSSRVCFVLDVSRSMGWNERLVAAQEEIIKVLELLPAKTRFNLVLYSDVAWAWKPRLTRATSSNVRRATTFVRRARPINGTNTHAALAKAFEDRDVDAVFVLTDGHPSVGAVTDPDMILLDVRRWNRHRRVRIHAITLLRGVPPPAFAGRENPDRAIRFMRDLAAQNDGIFKLVR